MADSGVRPAVLAISEDPGMLDLVAGILGQDEAFAVKRAPSAYEGWRSAGEDMPDLIIFDFQAAAEWLRLAFSSDPSPAAGPEHQSAEHQRAARKRVAHGRAAGSGSSDSGADCTVVYPLSLMVCERNEVPLIGPMLEQGVDDYIEKSFCPVLLLPRARSMAGARNLCDELKAEGERLNEINMLLKRNFKEMTALLLRILEARVPGASDRADDAKAMAQLIAKKLDYPEERRRNLIFAALMHEIGKVGLQDSLVGKHYNSLPAALKPAYRQYSNIGAVIISNISGYRESAEAVLHQLENLDGSGFPDELVGDEIPLGARILRAIVYQEELRLEGLSTEKIVERMRDAMHSVLDERIANFLIEFLLEQRRKVDTNRLKLRVDELKAGMVIGEDVYAASGVKLLPKGVQLQDKTLALLAERNESDPIIGGVYILTDWGLLYGA